MEAFVGTLDDCPVVLMLNNEYRILGHNQAYATKEWLLAQPGFVPAEGFEARQYAPYYRED